MLHAEKRVRRRIALNLKSGVEIGQVLQARNGRHLSSGERKAFTWRALRLHQQVVNLGIVPNPRAGGGTESEGGAYCAREQDKSHLATVHT